MAVRGAPRPTIGTAQLALLLEGETWRERGRGPLSRRLAHVLRSRVRAGLLPAGTVLPPERALAAALGLSRSTVVAALDELRAGGVVDSRHGSGTWVSATGEGDDPPIAADRLLHGSAKVNLAASVPADASHLPELRIDVADLAAVAPAHGYAPAGLPALREALALRYATRGLPTAVEQVHVTNGAQHALDLALAALTRRGDVVAVEDPTYVGVFDVLDAHGLRPLPIPLAAVDAGDGTLTRLCRAGRARAVFLLPGVHSPTGRVRDAAQLARLATELDTLGIPVVEDETVAELVFTGSRPPSLASFCTRAPVVSIESVSKVGWGGIRVGWLRAGAATVEQTVTDRARRDFGTGVVSQLVALRVLDDYDRLVAGRRARLRAAATTMSTALHRHLPEWRIEPPSGGLSLWVDTGIDAGRLAEHAQHHGVTVAPGSSASRGDGARTFLRLCFDRPTVEVEAALPRLTRAAEDARGWR